jgi:signal transduction histidine kinase
MTNRLSIYVKGFVLVAIPLFSQAVFLATLVKIRNDQADAQRWALHATDVLAKADALSALLAETHSALRGFLITGDAHLSTQYQGYRSRTDDKLSALAESVADNEDQTERINAVRAKAASLSGWFEAEYALIKGGMYDAAVEEARSTRGEKLIEEVRVALRDFMGEEERLSQTRQAALERQAGNQDLVLFGGGALALFSTALLGFIFARDVARRLRTLTDNARRLGEGQELLAPLDGSDELAQLDDVFRAMARSLQEKNQENEMFVYSVSHDLRSPLVNLQGFSQELAASGKDLRDLVSESELPPVTCQRALTLIDHNIGDSVRFIQTAVTRLSAIIDALLRLSRAGRVEYRWQVVDVQAAVRRIVEALGGTLAQRHAEMVVGELPPVWGDPTAIEQVFANLVGNAANYLDPQRAGRIEVGALPEPEAAPAGESRTYFVRDNGLGIAAAHQPKVFIAFQRLHPEAAAGEGVGLALVRRVVERHGGRIWLESTPGVGTTFFVSLPVRAPARLAVVRAGNSTARVA